LEGNNVARWLQEKGVAAFVLKYRIMEKRQEGIPSGMNMDEAGKYGIADGIQASKWFGNMQRSGASLPTGSASWASQPGHGHQRSLLQKDAAARPNFAAMIYGGPFGLIPAIPEKLPPMFLAWAQDDALALGPVVKFYDALTSAGTNPRSTFQRWRPWLRHAKTGYQ